MAKARISCRFVHQPTQWNKLGFLLGIVFGDQQSLSTVNRHVPTNCWNVSPQVLYEPSSAYHLHTSVFLLIRPCNSILCPSTRINNHCPESSRVQTSMDWNMSNMYQPIVGSLSPPAYALLTWQTRGLGRHYKIPSSRRVDRVDCGIGIPAAIILPVITTHACHILFPAIPSFVICNTVVVN